MQGQGQEEICCHFGGQLPHFDKCLSEDAGGRNLRVQFLAGRGDCSHTFGETANRSLEASSAVDYGPLSFVLSGWIVFNK